MGQGSWSRDAYADISSTRSKQTVSQNFVQSKSRKIHKDMDPRGVDMRESRDSADHPESLAIIFGLDETGSMGTIPAYLITNKLGTLMDTVIANGIEHPQIMFMGVGDHIVDSAPLQVGQFESATAQLDACLEKIYLEGGGGGNGGESYPLVWHFAARHTSIDCFEKRGEKGIIFTCGDEPFHEKYAAAYLKDKIGYTGGEDLNAKAMFDEASKMYEIFHIHINEGDTSNTYEKNLAAQWKGLLGERFLVLDNKDLVAELVATTVAVLHGVHLDTATASFDAATKNSVSNALALVKDSIVSTKGASAGVIAL